jgi:hypothetical protein
MPRAHGPADAFERRRGDVEQVNNAGAQYFKVSGIIEVIGPGEATISISFPVLFVDKPAFSYGPEVGSGQPTTIGNLPKCSVVVIAWDERVRNDGSVIYVGVQYAILTEGPADQVLFLQWHMEGVGLRDPIDEDED